MTNNRTIRRELMDERTKAIAAGNWQRMNELTKQIAELPMPGVAPLTQKDIDRYVAKKAR
jgi:hypothetical protein